MAGFTDAEKKDICERVDIRQFLKPSKGGLYECPICHSGTGEHKSGAAEYKPSNRIFCYACKAKTQDNKESTHDVIKVYQAVTGATFQQALSELGARIGIYHDDGQRGKKPQAAAAKKAEGRRVSVHDYREFIEDAAAKIEEKAAAEYLASRKISIETAKKFRLGYAAKWRNPKGGKVESPRLIVPCSDSFYFARDIRKGVKDYTKQNVGNTEIFNADALTGGGVLFVTEGAFDALSVIEAGFPAVALMGAGNGNLLIDAADKAGFCGVFLLALDADEAGKNAAEKLKELLDDEGYSSEIVDICGNHKDANEFLVDDPDGFPIACLIAEDAGKKMLREGLAADSISSFINSGEWEKELEFSAVREKTGFPSLDSWLGGGVYTGLTVLSGVPSLGKTTFLWSIGENIAMNGGTVLFFSLELSKGELLAKSLSRRAWQRGRDISAADVEQRKDDCPDELQDFKRETENRLCVIQGGFGYGLQNIAAKIKQYRRRGCKRLVCIVDYLQAVSPSDAGGAESVMISEIAKGLRQIARDNHCAILAASSSARTTYNDLASFGSFYGSCGIEYSTDCAGGLVLSVIGSELWIGDKASEKESARKLRQSKLVERAKAEKPRRVTFYGLKNRKGKATCEIAFLYDARHNEFKETTAAEYPAEMSAQDVEDLAMAFQD